MTTGLIKSKRIGLPFYETGKQLILRTSVAGLFLISSGCLSGGDNSTTGSGNTGQCVQPFDKTLVALQIKNKHDLYFDITQMDFLLDPTLVIDEMNLEGTLVQHHGRIIDYDFAFNGTKASRQDGDDVLALDCGKPNDKSKDSDHNTDRCDQHKFCSPAHKFFLNGGLSTLALLIQIQTHKGDMKLQFNGRDSEVLDGRLVVHGRKMLPAKDCSTPPPPPPPPPAAPKTTLVSETPSKSPTSSTTEQFTFSADQNGVTFYCAADGAAASACVSPMIYTNLANGNHSFSVYAKNSAGLSDAVPPGYSWVVDSVPPSVSIDNLASLKTLTNQGAISVLFSSSDAISFSCVLDNGAAAACTSPVAYANLTEGQHSVIISAVDAAGNVSTQPAVFQWTIDMTLPVTSMIDVNPSAPVNNSTSMNFQFAANESSTFECSIDNGPFAACTSPVNLASLAEGNHWFQARATDIAGNRGLSASYSWRTDLTAPVIMLGNVVPAQGSTGAHVLSVDFSLSEAGSAMCSFDGADAAPCTSPFTETLGGEGVHTLVISAQDVAGNAAQPKALTWTMDYTNPQLSFGAILPSALSNLNSADFSAEIEASEPVVLQASLNGVDLGAVASPIILTGLAEGSYHLEVTGADLVGNPANLIMHDFVVDLTAPTVTLQSAHSGVVNVDSNTLTFNADEAANFECNIDSAGFAPCSSPMNLSGLAEGDHQALVRATDPAGNVSVVVSAAWTVDTVAPLTSISSQQTGSHAILFTLTSSESGSTFLCAVDGATPAACVSPVTVSGLGDGNHNFRAWAVDGAGNADPAGALATFAFLPPITTSLLSESPAAPLTNSRSMTFTFSASQTGGTFRCSLDGGAPAACSSPMSYSGLADGSHTFKVQAIDSYGGVDATGASYAWSIDTVVPTVVSSSASVTSTTITVTWTTSEPTTTKLLWGKDTALDHVVAEDSTYVTVHSVKLTGLSSNTTYSLQPAGTDRAGNVFTGTKFTAKTSR